MEHARNEYTACFPARVWVSNRLGAMNSRSPCSAAIRLYSGVYVKLSPVPNGEPAAGSEG